MPPDFCVKTLCTNIHFDTIIILDVFFSFYFQFYDQIGGFNFNTKIFISQSHSINIFSAKLGPIYRTYLNYCLSKICKKKNKL